jgi:hypothetical protein
VGKLDAFKGRIGHSGRKERPRGHQERSRARRRARRLIPEANQYSSGTAQPALAHAPDARRVSSSREDGKSRGDGRDEYSQSFKCEVQAGGWLARRPRISRSTTRWKRPGGCCQRPPVGRRGRELTSPGPSQGAARSHHVGPPSPSLAKASEIDLQRTLRWDILDSQDSLNARSGGARGLCGRCRTTFGGRP